ncbi:hypothetical protein RRSWK_01879 [Rhodopirellula sp. SWK7]|nr:hypothetical protein RRSWK_01879 [Rhodopirellula sp. SWK7]
MDVIGASPVCFFDCRFANRFVVLMRGFILSGMLCVLIAGGATGVYRVVRREQWCDGGSSRGAIR